VKRELERRNKLDARDSERLRKKDSEESVKQKPKP